ncbi:MAG: hypothetical protein ACRDFX_04085 [Chloroflexota bacterium]
MRRLLDRRTFVSMVVLGGGGLLAARGIYRPRASASATGGVPAWLVALASRAAALNGVPHPTHAEAVFTTRQRAIEAQSAGWVASDQPAYLVVLQGDFADTHARTPNGQTIYGTVMTLIVDPVTRGTLDYGLGYHLPDMSQLGPVTDFSDQL